MVQDESGIYTLKFPHSPNTVLPNVAISDTGKLVNIILEAGAVYFKKSIVFWAQALSEAEKLAELGECMFTFLTSIVDSANPGYRLQCPHSLRPSDRRGIPRDPHDP